MEFDWSTFGSAGEVWDQLGRYTFDFSGSQWECVKALLDGLEGVNLREHMRPAHLKESATIFDDQDEGYAASSTMESEVGEEGGKKGGKGEGEETEGNSSVVVRVSQGGVRVGLSG